MDDMIYGMPKERYQQMIDVNLESSSNFFNMGLGNVLIANGDIKTEDGIAYVIFLKTSKTVDEIINPPSKEAFFEALKTHDPEWTFLHFPTVEQRNTVAKAMQKTWTGIDDNVNLAGGIPFITWMEELNSLYQANNTDGHEYKADYNDIENCTWHNYYLDGLTPQEALSEDFSYA